MRNITKIFTLVLSLILLFAVSCSNDDKTGVKNNPTENDTEITDGETGSGSSSGGSSETGTGGETGGSGSGSETGGTGTGGGGTEIPPSPSEPETTETIDAEYFPTELLGTYRDEKVELAGYTGDYYYTKVSYDTTTKKTKIGEGIWLKDGTDSGQKKNFSIEKWKQTKKGGKTIKLEGEYVNGVEKYTIIYDYASETLSGKYTHPDGTWSFNGKKIS